MQLNCKHYVYVGMGNVPMHVFLTELNAMFINTQQALKATTENTLNKYE